MTILNKRKTNTHSLRSLVSRTNLLLLCSFDDLLGKLPYLLIRFKRFWIELQISYLPFITCAKKRGNNVQKTTLTQRLEQTHLLNQTKHFNVSLHVTGIIY